MNGAIPGPQGAAVLDSADVPLTTAGVYDCVMIYLYTEFNPAYHVLIHYDRYCSPKDLDKVKKDLKSFGGPVRRLKPRSVAQN